MIHIFVTLGDLVSTFWGVLSESNPANCSSGLNRPENETKKTKQWHKAEEETKVSGIRWLGEE